MQNKKIAFKIYKLIFQLECFFFFVHHIEKIEKDCGLERILWHKWGKMFSFLFGQTILKGRH